MCINVDGAIAHYRAMPKTRKTGFLRNGVPMDARHAIDYLRLCQYEGKRVIPMGDGCYRFSFQNGCPGHIKSLTPTDSDEQKIQREWEYFISKKQIPV